MRFLHAPAVAGLVEMTEVIILHSRYLALPGNAVIVLLEAELPEKVCPQAETWVQELACLLRLRSG